MLYLMRCQVFYDGNERTATMIANQIMIQNGVGTISIPIEKQEEFKTELLKYYENGNMYNIKCLIYDECIDRINFIKEK